MQDIRDYTEQELSLIVMNDEYLYTELRRAARRENFGFLVSTLDELFIYTKEQLKELEDDFLGEVTEMEEEE
jgi:hypothetical protein